MSCAKKDSVSQRRCDEGAELRLRPRFDDREYVHSRIGALVVGHGRWRRNTASARFRWWSAG